MVRSELVAALACHHPDLASSLIDQIVTCLFDAITDRLASGGRVELRGFGAFATKVQDARLIHHPKTGEILIVPTKRIPCFRPGKAMQASLNVNWE